MNQKIKTQTFFFLLSTCLSIPIFSQPSNYQEENRAIEFPDIEGYLTLKCDFHMHTVLSDGSVWPNIRIQEAILDGLDAISITDHLEYQPKKEDIPHQDRNRSYELALKAADGKDLIVINGAEITRSMPPGHANAIFIKDANKLNQDDVLEVFREAKRQGAFVFYNHPHWTSQQKDGVATLHELHHQLLNEGLLDGIEIVNGDSYSDEAFQIAQDYNLSILGNSDVHGLIDWQYDVNRGGQRPLTLVYAKEKSEGSIKQALEGGRSAVWFNNTLFGESDLLVPMIQNSLVVSRLDDALVQTLMIENQSDADYILENISEFTFHDHASVFILKAHKTTRVRVKILENRSVFNLRFRVLNAYTGPGSHPEIYMTIE